VKADPAWKSALLHKGQDVADLLEAVLAGKEVHLDAMPAPVNPEVSKELRLRRFLDQIDRAIQAFDTDAFGRCEVCGTDLPRSALAQQPWLSSCPAHAAMWRS
jgi:RNA polymerase-binding transcription factor DksA